MILLLFLCRSARSFDAQHSVWDVLFKEKIPTWFKTLLPITLQWAFCQQPASLAPSEGRQASRFQGATARFVVLSGTVGFDLSSKDVTQKRLAPIPSQGSLKRMKKGCKEKEEWRDAPRRKAWCLGICRKSDCISLCPHGPSDFNIQEDNQI